MNKINLSQIGTFTSTDGAEIVAHDPTTQRLFVTTGDTVEVIDISDPANPTKVNDINVTSIGDGANSVAVKNGIVAIAVEANTSQDDGVVAFYDADGNSLGTPVTVGPLPDMLTFTPDGMKVIVANEGEPSDDYTVDPEGSISIIDISGGIASATVTTADFAGFNDRKQELIEKGVRIFGPGATVAEDLEPEYIAVSADGSTAIVTLQENNAIAVVDIASATVADVLPLGVKDHSKGQPSLTQYEFSNLPVLGTTEGGQDILLGGLSGLFYEGREGNNLKFVTVPDRGPNGNSSDVDGDGDNDRPFALPDYQARVVKFELNETTGAIENLSEVLLTREDGTTPITGRPNIPGVDEEPVDLFGNLLGYDEFGADLEGVVIDGNDNFWMVDEYRPAIYNFDSTGKLINRFVPQGTGELGGQPAGTYGTETLPAQYSSRRRNRGFEAVALDTDSEILYAFIQTPLANPDRDASDNSDVIRILGIDPATGNPVSEYVYLLEDPAVRDGGRVDKIGDAVYVGDGKFQVIERDSAVGENAKKFIFDTNLQGATNLLNSYFVNVNSSITGAEFDANLQLQVKEENSVLNFNLSSSSQDILNLVTGNLSGETVITTNSDGSISGSVILEDTPLLTQAINVLMDSNPGETIDSSIVTTLLPDFFPAGNPLTGVVFPGLSATTQSLEQLSADELGYLDINPVNKTKVLNLPSIGYQAGDKPEGLALLDDGRLAVLNDNDFGLLDEDIPVDGTVPVNPDPTPVVLGIIDFPEGNQLDASNEDGKIDIKNHPVLGMYQPDAIASFEVDGKTFYITANEGDARDYDGFSEEERVKDLTLDSTAYPDAATLQQDENLGRLKTTNTLGDYDGDGDVDQIFSYGGRSFSIWDEVGNLVFDSGDQIAEITSTQTPELFNANDGIAAEFDERSDDKGAEPESVTVGTINGKPYGFIGLERAGGGVLVYDLSNPSAPDFIQYIRTEGDIAPEGLQFIAAEDSPNGNPILAVANEVSNTTTLYDIKVLNNTLQIIHTLDDGTTVEGIDLTGFNNQVTVDFTISREADFDNQVYFYAVDDITGSIGDVEAGDSSYLQTALGNIVHAEAFETFDDAVNEAGSLTFDAGSVVVPLIIVDGTLEQALSGAAEVYFPYLGANSDGQDHIRFNDTTNTFEFEDLPELGDNDFNDIVIKIESIA